MNKEKAVEIITQALDKSCKNKPEKIELLTLIIKSYLK